MRYVHGGVAEPGRGESLGPRVMQDYEWVWVQSGRPTYWLDGDPHPLHPGSVLLARPGFDERYSWDPKRSTKHAFFHFAVRSLPPDLPPLQRWPVLAGARATEVILPIFQHIIERWLGDPTPATLRPPPPQLQRMIFTMLDALTQDAVSAPRAAAYPEPVCRALSWVMRTLDEQTDAPIALRNLAAAAHVTEKHLCRTFSASLHATPMAVVRQLRLERALVLLARTNLSVQQVAARCGFASPQHFSRCVHASYGRPPTELRRDMMSHGRPPRGSLRIDAARVRGVMPT